MKADLAWTAPLEVGDAVIVREDTSAGLRYVLHTQAGAQLACQTFVEAEACALEYARQARTHAWFSDAGRLQLLAPHPPGARAGTPAPASRSRVRTSVRTSQP
jgi:hypothetical protein